MSDYEENREIVPRSLPTIKNDRLLRAAYGKECDRIPIWIMRQAGRHDPNYREFTKDKDFFSICRNPIWACEVTLLPIRRYDLDAAVIFSDILVLPQALGWDFVMHSGEGPKCTNPLRERANFACFLNSITESLPQAVGTNLRELFETEDPLFFDAFDQSLDIKLYESIVNQSLNYVCEAIHTTRLALEGRIPLIGFVGAPWTLFSYVAEGGSSKLFMHAKKWLYACPRLVHCVLKVLSGCAAAFLIRQIDAGASAVQVFESHAGEIPPELFDVFCSPYLAQIAIAVKKHRRGVPLILFCKGHVDYSLGGPELYDVLSIDSRQSLKDAMEASSGRFSVQGNLDTAALHSPNLANITTQMLESAVTADGAFLRTPKRYIANLGHGITPDCSPSAVEKFIEIVHSFTNPKFRALEAV